MNTQMLENLLQGLPVNGVRWHETLGSTNDEALAWLAASAPEGSLVAADVQTRGRGRSGRRWITRAGASLAFSLLLKPQPIELPHLTLFTALGALALASALEEIGLKPQIKWPNDVLLNGRKTAGILVEAAWTGAQLDGVVIGIGLNVAQEAVPPDDQVLFPATSVESALGHLPDRFALLRSIVAHEFVWRTHLTTDAFFDAWRQRLAYIGEQVDIEPGPTGGSVVRGTLNGVNPDGNLLIKLDNGNVQTVSVGDVHLRLG